MGQKISTLLKGRKTRNTEKKTVDSGSSTNNEPSDEYLAQPSGACCLKGTLHEGEARGSWETIADVETYISHPPEGKENGRILLYFPDVWGMFPNGLLIMDGFADAGYLVLGLDYFRGVSSSIALSLFMIASLNLPNIRIITPRAANWYFEY